MTDKQINRWLRRKFSGIGWILVAYYVLMNAMAMLTMLLDSLKQLLQGAASPDMDVILGNGTGYLMTIALGALLLTAWKGTDYWKREIFVREKSMGPDIFACFLCFCAGAQMVNSLWITLLELVMNSMGASLLPLLDSVAGASDTFSMFLYASILAPVAEEVLFRGYVLRSLRPYGKRFAIVGSAVLFGMFHGNLLQTPYAVTMGLVLGYLAVEYSIFWSILLHMFNNLVLADMLTRLTAQWSDMAYGMLNLILFGGGFLLSLMILIRNRQKIRDYQKSEWMDRRVLKCFFGNPGVLTLLIIALGNMLALFHG